MKREEILQTAENLINGARAKEYGDAQKNLQDIADLWTVILEKDVTLEQVALCMIMVKAARLMKTNHLDSWIDICGYAALGGED
jgi:hypothetical protein